MCWCQSRLHASVCPGFSSSCPCDSGTCSKVTSQLLLWERQRRCAFGSYLQLKRRLFWHDTSSLQWAEEEKVSGHREGACFFAFKVIIALHYYLFLWARLCSSSPAGTGGLWLVSSQWYWQHLGPVGASDLHKSSQLSRWVTLLPWYDSFGLWVFCTWLHCKYYLLTTDVMVTLCSYREYLSELYGFF